MDIAVDDFVRFAERTLDGMASSVSRLDDEQVNAVTGLPGANSPFTLVTHAIGAFGWWTGHMVCGQASTRVREDEFLARGSVAELAAAVEAARAQLREIRPRLESATDVADQPQLENPLAGEWTVGAALMHAYEELAQHLGHLEITVDVIVAWPATWH